MRNIFDAVDSASLVVSLFATATKTRSPLLIDEISCPFTVTDAHLTLCSIAIIHSFDYLYVYGVFFTFHGIAQLGKYSQGQAT